MMRIIPVKPGTPEWLAHRDQTFNASEAAAMLGLSPHQTRSELLHQKFTGLKPEFTDYKQRRVIDPGHAYEALARAKADRIVGDMLAPVVGVIDVPGISRAIGASFDGLTFAYDIDWEHKSLNDELRAALPNPGPEGNDAKNLPIHHLLQMEQQLLVSGAERALFMASKWDGDECIDCRCVWYTSDPALRAQIIGGWRQFDADLAAYVPPEIVAPAVAAPVEALPLAMVTITGTLTVESNLAALEPALRAYVERLPKAPSTDQEFADLQAAVKRLDELEKALAAEEARALAGIADVEKLRRTVANMIEIARSARLTSNTLVENQKKLLKQQQVLRGQKLVADHIAALNERLGEPLMPTLAPQFLDFAAAIKGLSKDDSVKNAVDTKVASAKIEANRIAHQVDVNMKHLAPVISEFPTLFPDRRTLLLKDPDDFRAVVANRVSDHRRQEELRRQREAQTATPAPTAPPAAATPPAPAQTATAPSVVPMRARTAPAASDKPALKLGDINARFGHGFTMTREFTKLLGVPGVPGERGAVLYSEHDFERLCEALERLAASVRERHVKQAA